MVYVWHILEKMLLDVEFINTNQKLSLEGES